MCVYSVSYFPHTEVSTIVLYVYCIFQCYDINSKAQVCGHFVQYNFDFLIYRIYWQGLFRFLCAGFWHHVVWQTDMNISEELVSIINVEVVTFSEMSVTNYQ